MRFLRTGFSSSSKISRAWNTRNAGNLAGKSAEEVTKVHGAKADNWARLTKAATLGLVFLIGFNVFFASHEHDDGVQYPYKKIAAKDFPWGDGQTPLFDTLAKKMGSKSDEHH